MIWNSIPADVRLHLWKKLRAEIENKSIEFQLESISQFFKDVPLGPRSVDYYTPDTWPTPWEILFHGSFCTSSVSILMFYTLILANTKHKIELWVVKDNEGDYLLPIIDDQYVLNYSPGEVSSYPDIQDYFIVMQKFPQAQIKTIT